MSKELNPDSKTSTRKLIVILVGIIVYIILTVLPTPEGLAYEGQKAISLMICALIFWVLEALPISVTALLFTAMQPLLGIVNPGAMAANFLPSSFFFTLSCFLIGQALLDTGLGNRIVLLLLRASKNNPRKLLFLLMGVTSLISFVIANLALSAMMLPLMMKIFEENDLKPMQSNFAKALLIGVPVAISIGGCGTPAGALPNYQVMALTKEVTGVSISFGTWTALGGPLAVILTLLAYVIVVAIFKPEMKELKNIDYNQRIKDLGRITTKELIFVIIFALLIASWFVFPSIPMPITAIVACAIFFLPKLQILTGESFMKAVNWPVLLLLCGSTGLAMAIFQTGGAAWIANTVLQPFQSGSLVIIIAVLIFLTIYMHLLVPPNPSLVAVLVPIVGLFAMNMGVSVTLLILPLAYAANCAFLVPFDPVIGLTYSTGYYSMKDLPKIGVPISVVWIIIGTALMAIFGMNV